MATIEVKIFAESISDYQAALAQLTNRNRPEAPPAVEAVAGSANEAAPETKADDSTPARRTRGPNKPATVAADQRLDDPASPAGTDTEAGTGAATSVTLADVQAAATKFMAPGVGSQLQAQTLLKEHFKTAAGEPVARFSALQASDYAACVALFEANTKAA